MLSLKAPLELPEVIITQSVGETIRVSQGAPERDREWTIPEEEPTHPQLCCAPCEA